MSDSYRFIFASPETGQKVIVRNDDSYRVIAWTGNPSRNWLEWKPLTGNEFRIGIAVSRASLYNLWEIV